MIRPTVSATTVIWLAAVALAGVSSGVVVAQTTAPVSVTFYKDVAPLLQENCETCHRPGQIAPMSFQTYESTRPWARAIKTAVLSKKMPPWFAEGGTAHLLNGVVAAWLLVTRKGRPIPFGPALLAGFLLAATTV